MNDKVYILKTTNVKEVALEVSIFADAALSAKTKNNDRSNYSVLVKPNAVGPYLPKKGVTTSPDLINALCENLHKKKYSVVMGDCPGESSGSTDDIFLTTELLNDKTKKYYKNIGTSATRIRLDCLPKGNICVSSFALDADLVISAAKAKTSCYMIFSGAVKNLYGIIPGTLKAKLHENFPQRDDFARMLIELSQIPKKTITVIDGSVIMEGNGPTHGELRKENIYIISKNIYAADFALAVLMGLKPNQVPTVKLSIKQGLFSPDKLEIISDISFEKLKNFKPPTTLSSYINGENIIPDSTVKTIASVRIIFDDKKCIRCGICKKACPVKAITLSPFPKTDYNKCINCFCCNELCPEGAALPETDIKKLWDKVMGSEAKN